MKSFRHHLGEENVVTAMSDGTIDINNDSVRAQINGILDGITSRSCVTPYNALTKIRKALSYFHIDLPGKAYLSGKSGVEVWNIQQFGPKSGMNDQGEFIKDVPSKYHLVFHYYLIGSMYGMAAKVVSDDELGKHMDTVERMVNEETLEELKKDTLKSYIKKAGDQRVAHSQSYDSLSNAAGEKGYSTKDEIKRGGTHLRKMKNRRIGVDRAVDRLEEAAYQRKRPIGPKEPKEVIRNKLSDFAKREYERVAWDLPKEGQGHNWAAIDHGGDAMYDKYGDSYPKLRGKFSHITRQAIKGYLDRDEPKRTRANERKQERAWARKNNPKIPTDKKPKDLRDPYNQRAGYTFLQKPRRSKMTEAKTYGRVSRPGWKPSRDPTPVENPNPQKNSPAMQHAMDRITAAFPPGSIKRGGNMAKMKGEMGIKESKVHHDLTQKDDHKPTPGYAKKIEQEKHDKDRKKTDRANGVHMKMYMRTGDKKWLHGMKEETINEISKELVRRYKSKSHASFNYATGKRDDDDFHERNKDARDYNGNLKWHQRSKDAQKKDDKTIQKRLKGLTMATKRLSVKEETINEISKGLLVRYMEKSKKRSSQLQRKYNAATNTDADDKEFNRRVKGQVMASDKFHKRSKVKASGNDRAFDAAQKMIMRKEETINEISRKLAGEYLKKSAHNQYDLAVKHKKATGKERLDLGDKIERRREGQKLAILKRGARVQATEETLDEVSRKKLIDYSVKSKTDYLDARDSGDEKREAKRTKGRLMADKKMYSYKGDPKVAATEETQVNEVSAGLALRATHHAYVKSDQMKRDLHKEPDMHSHVQANRKAEKKSEQGMRFAKYAAKKMEEKWNWLNDPDDAESQQGGPGRGTMRKFKDKKTGKTMYSAKSKDGSIKHFTSETAAKKWIKEETQIDENLGKAMKKYKRWTKTAYDNGDPRNVKKRLKDADPSFVKGVADQQGKLGGAAELQRRLAKRMQKEETINEVSKKLLGRYIKGASHDVATRSALTGRHAVKSKASADEGDYNKAKIHDKLSDKAFAKSWDRRKHIAKAVDRLTKEETINEVSRKKAFAAYAGTQDPDRDDDDGLYKTGERLKGHIKKKWGKEGVSHAERHAFATHFGRGKKNVKEETE